MPPRFVGNRRDGPRGGNRGQPGRCVYTKASLELETARIALLEYQEGLVTQSTKEFEARIALARSDLERQADRVAWAEGMTVKGYLAQGQLLSERHTLTRLRHELAIAEGQFRLFRRFEVPREIHRLRTEIQTAEINSRLESDRLKVAEDELAYLKKQIGNCTVRAPQDGVVVYANGNRWWPRPLEPGTPVYEGQSLFLIPDLGRMEVNVSLHETMGPRVRAGMKASVRIASRPDRVISGKVAAIEMLSTPNWKEWDENVRHFLVRVQLDQTPPAALPFMSATVEIDTGRVSNALVIPVEAMAIEDGEPSCYVVSDDGLERRPIQTHRATRDFVEVTGGLYEGEHVVSRSVDVNLTTFGELIHQNAGHLAHALHVWSRCRQRKARSFCPFDDGRWVSVLSRLNPTLLRSAAR